MKILTTHVGSLVRPPEFVDFLLKQQNHEPYDPRAYDECLKRSVAKSWTRARIQSVSATYTVRPRPTRQSVAYSTTRIPATNRALPTAWIVKAEKKCATTLASPSMRRRPQSPC